MTFFLYDAALNGLYTLLFLQNKFPVHQCLFKGTKDETLVDVAPYIFGIENEVEKFNDLELSLNEIIFLESTASVEELAQHFRDFIYQKVEERECYFRFWDGRVLKKFLPTCTAIQLYLFFGPIDSFIVQENSNAFRFRYDSINFITEKGTVEEFKPSLGSFVAKSLEKSSSN